MRDYRAALEPLRKDVAEAALIRDIATDKAKQDVERAMSTAKMV